MKKVSFTEMKKGTKEDYLFLDKHEKNFASKTADRLLKFMSGLTETLEGYQVSRLEHSLQSASRAHNNGESEEMVVAALLHDIGDELAPMNHSEYAASILKPYVTEKTHWIIEKHGEFQMFYYAHHLGGDRNKRDKYIGHKYYQDTIDFCEKYDQNSFDPNYRSYPLDFFKPIVKKIFSRKPYSLL
jgi:predicted HD phosphohydrolase